MADFKTVTHALRSEEKMWREQSDALGRLAGFSEQLRISRIEAGMFQVVFSAYEAAIDQVSKRCTEGQLHTDKIADALKRNADAYDNGEEETTKHIENAY